MLDDPSLFFRIGDARELLSQNDVGFAVRELRAVHKLDPANAMADKGLTLLRQWVVETNDPVAMARLYPESEWYPGWLFSPLAVVIGYFAWCVFCAAITRWYQVRSRRWLVIAACLTPFVLIPPTNELVRHFRNERDRAAPPVTISEETQLREGNGEFYPSKLNLPVGVECRKIGERGNWLQVEFASGLTGWVWEPCAIVAD
jgi:hypothetical protein